MFEFVRCSKNDVRVRSMFDKMVFNTSLVECLNIYVLFWLFHRKYLANCQVPETFKIDKTILSTKCNGQLGNQISAFATLYGLSKLSDGKLRYGINFKQFEVLSSAFSFFDEHFDEILVDSWYCGLKPSDMKLIELGNLLKVRNILIHL